MKQKRILVLCPYPEGEAAGQRLKYEQYFDHWEENGFQITVSSFSDQYLWNNLYASGNNINKILGTLRGYLRRFRDLFRLKQFDIVYVFMWVSPFGTTIFERITRKLSNKLIYDFDDAVHIGSSSSKLTLIQKIISLLRGKNKVNFLIKNADQVIVSSPFHVEYCKELNLLKACEYIPCSLDGNRFMPSKIESKNKEIVVGWTGTFSSKFYLDSLRKVFLKLKDLCDYKLLIIGNFSYDFPSINLEVVQWSKASEVQDLQRIDIGIYPLIQDDWGLGKGALKAMHYMSIGVPVVATDFGTTSIVVKDNVNGYLVSTDSEWINALEMLIKDKNKREKFGSKGREIFESKYSTDQVKGKYLSLLKKF